jgi:hypothetical protein
MASGRDLSSPSTQEFSRTELSGDDLRLHHKQLYATLDTLCESPVFRNSPKSCEFIRHVVHCSLEGRADELKERLIGMSLLGRDASYDTSTDSGVRVRANDVRKRLIKYSETPGAGFAFSIVLPTGTYVPQFFRITEGVPEHKPEEILPVELSAGLPARQLMQSLSSFQLAIPTLVAIFLCIICMRWQLAQEQYFTNFWQGILREDPALLYFMPQQTENKQGLVALKELDEAAPLLDLAGQFHRRFSVMGPGSTVPPGRAALHVGLNVGKELYSASQLPERYWLVNHAGSWVIVDRKDSSRPLFYHAALLTIVNGPQPTIYIDGTDDGAIRSLVARLCDESAFPRGLTDSFHPGTMIQAVFPTENRAKAILDRELLASSIAKLEYLP